MLTTRAPLRGEPHKARKTGGLGQPCAPLTNDATQREEVHMPFIPILLWVGVPAVLFGGGYVILQAMH